MLQQQAARPRVRKKRPQPRRSPGRLWALFILSAMVMGVAVVGLQAHYTFTLQPPVRLRFQWPLVIAPRVSAEETGEAQADQGRRLTAYQQYACNKFGPACRIALAVQRAENPHGACEIYHYNTDGTLDWGYFQINTVHLKRAGVNLRDLLDCKANIDFAYKLYTERGFEPWTTFNSGAYRQFLRKF
ncbi:MAG TPA: hypothetical protein VMT86_09185 [Bryobacteraceae bacterium]|nr:hypothetical protein [Bryobacteraceae bacterium]